MAAAVCLSILTLSEMARSLSDRGFTWKISICSAGIIQGAPGAKGFRYCSARRFRPVSVISSSELPSTLTMTLGFHSLDKNAFLVLLAC